MKYTIKEIEGIDNFMQTYSANPSEKTDPYRRSESLLTLGMVIKPGMLVEGDEIQVELTEFTSYTRQEIKTVTGFKVVQHDSFLLKLVKQ